MSWRDDAACQGTDVEAFFPPKGRMPGRLVLAICASCPVRTACLEEAMANEQSSHRNGVWGGLSTGQRERLHRCRTGQCRHTSPAGCRPVLQLAEAAPA